MRNLNQPTRWLMIPATTLVAVLASPTTASVTACMELDKAACEREARCTWVDPYKRMDGVKVKGFCRATQRPDEREGE